MPLVRARDLRNFLDRSPNMRTGCLVDTNILFAANYSLDHFHETAIEIFETLIEERVPRFANANVRSEFIHLSRKVVIAQALLDLFHAVGTDLPSEVYNKLKSIKTRSATKEKEESLFRLQDSEIEQIRALFASYRPNADQDLWDWFCEDYLKGKISSEWNWVEEDFGINFLTLRYTENSLHLENELKWEDVVRIIERTGIGSADAMIVNLLIQSKYNFIVSGDSDIIFALERINPENKFVVAP